MIGPSDISNSIPIARTRATSRHPRPALAAAAMTLVLILLLSSCGDRGDVGIFASIEREEKIEKSNLPEVSTAGSMVYDAGEDKYYVALGQLYSRGRGSNDWDDVDHPSEYKDGHTLDIVSVNGTIYVAFFDTLSTKSELFALNPSNDNFNKVWSPGKEISKLLSVNTNGATPDEELYAVTVASNKDTYELYYPSIPENGTNGSNSSPIASNLPRIFDGAYDDANDEYFFVSTGQLYEGGGAAIDGNGGPESLAEHTSPSGMTNFSGITFAFAHAPVNGDDNLYLTSPKGEIAYSANGGGAWTEIGGDSDDRYTDILYADIGSYSGLFVGMDTRETSPGGYFEVTPAPGLSRSKPDGDNYRAADISDASIHSFYVDTANQTLFALTNGDGLWSATYDGGEPEWSWE